MASSQAVQVQEAGLPSLAFAGSGDKLALTLERLLHQVLDQQYYSTVTCAMEVYESLSQAEPADDAALQTWVQQHLHTFTRWHCLGQAAELVRRAQVLDVPGRVVPCVSHNENGQRVCRHAAAIFPFQHSKVATECGVVVLDPGCFMTRAAVLRNESLVHVSNERTSMVFTAAEVLPPFVHSEMKEWIKRSNIVASEPSSASSSSLAAASPSPSPSPESLLDFFPSAISTDTLHCICRRGDQRHPMPFSLTGINDSQARELIARVLLGREFWINMPSGHFARQEPGINNSLPSTLKLSVSATSVLLEAVSAYHEGGIVKRRTIKKFDDARAAARAFFQTTAEADRFDDLLQDVQRGPGGSLLLRLLGVLSSMYNQV